MPHFDARFASDVATALTRVRSDTHGAVVTVVEDVAEGGSGPLSNVPFTAKDVIETAGLRSTAASRALEDHVPANDALAVARMRSAGAVLVGKTNCSELALSAWTGNPLFPETDNPLYPGRSPGGSSGGCAAAIAAGLVPISLGTDYGGSIRYPAICCGVVGLRPTAGRVPAGGQLPIPDPDSPRARFSLLGPLGRTVADVTAAFAVLADDARPAAPATLVHTPNSPPAWLREAAEVFSALRNLDTYDDLRPIASDLGAPLQRLIADAPIRADPARRRKLDGRRERLLEAALADLEGDLVLALPVTDAPIPPPAGRAPDPESLWPARAISLLGLPALALGQAQLVGPPGADEVLLATAASL